MSGRDTPRDLENAPVYGHDGQSSSKISAMDVRPGKILESAYAKTLGREIYHSSTNWINAGRRLKWNDSLRAFQGLHPSGSKYLSTDYRYRSRLFRPKTRSMVRKSEASTAAAFFSNEDVMTITAQDDDDKQQQASAEIMQRIMQYRLTKTIPWFLTVVGARQDAEVMGICIGKAYWKYSEKHVDRIQQPKQHPETQMPMLGPDGQLMMEDYDVYNKVDDHPWADLIAPENFRFDPGADWRNPIATSPYTIELIPMYIADVKAKIDSGEWNYVSDSSLYSASDLDDDVTRRSREQGRVPGKDHDAWKPRPFDICWVRENIVRYGGEEWHYYTLGSAGELLTDPRPLSEVYLQGIRPYVCGFVLPEAHKTYPSSKAEIIRDLQTQTNDVTNLRLDNVKLALNPRQFLSAGLGIDPQDMRVFMPGKTVITSIKTNPRDAIAWDRPPDMTGSSYQEQDRLNMDFDELVGGTSNSSIQGNRQVYEAVGNMETMTGNASQIEEYDQRVFAETFVEPMLRQIVKLEQAYETDSVILAMAGKEAQLVQKFGINEITDELLKQELTIKVNVGIGATNPQKRLQNFLTAADAVGKLFGPAAAMGTNFEEITKEVFGLCGYKDGERFFMPGFDIHAAMQQMQQGKGSKQEDPQAKIQIAQATQQAQAQQDAESHRMEMQEMQLGHQQKLQEMQMKFQLEMEKMHSTRQQQMMQSMAQRPAATVQFDTGDALNKVGQNLQGMAGQHGKTLEALHQTLAPVAQFAQGIGNMMHHGQQQAERHAQQHIFHTQNLTNAIERLTQAHMQEEEAVRDKDGKIIGKRKKPPHQKGNL